MDAAELKGTPHGRYVHLLKPVCQSCDLFCVFKVRVMVILTVGHSKNFST